MKKALQQAQILPSAVDYINAHATSTPLGDAAENQAIETLMLGEQGRQKSSEVNLSSTKGAIGHLLGAAGAVEALFTILTIHEVWEPRHLFLRSTATAPCWDNVNIRQNVIPPTINLASPDKDFNCNYVANTAQQANVQVALTNSFGFGGTNASLCFKNF